MVPWNGFDGFASLEPTADEGLTSPPITLTAFASFAMPGVAANLNQIMVGSNGEIYLADSTAGLLQPTGGIGFGATSVDDLRGGPGGSPRILALGDDLDASTTGVWDVRVDQSVPGQVRVTWVDATRWSTGTDQFSFSATLFDGGSVELSYDGNVPADFQIVGISTGNDVGSVASPSLDLSNNADSGTEGLLYQAFDPATWDLGNTTILLVPNGIGGYLSIKTCEPASHENYGIGCYTQNETLYQFFDDAVQASAALQGNAMLLTPGANGYTANWIPGVAGALFVPPTGGATSLPVDDDGDTLVTPPSIPLPVPGGVATDFTVGHNGVVTLGTVANNPFDYTVTGPEVATQTGAAFYSFSDWRDNNTVPLASGTIKTEEVGGVYYITWDGVDHWATPQVNNPSTFQFQFDLNTGNVTIVWVTIDTNTTSTFGSTHLVGYTGPGAGSDPGSTNLAVALPRTTGPDSTGLTLNASPAPVINPSTLVTYTATNLPEFQPASGIYLATLFFSVNPLPGGFDVAGILTNTPGCNAYIATLDVDLGAQVVFAPTVSWNFTFNNVVFAPGNVIAAQSVALYDGAFPLPNGENGGFLLSNGVLSNVQAN